MKAKVYNRKKVLKRFFELLILQLDLAENNEMLKSKNDQIEAYCSWYIHIIDICRRENKYFFKKNLGESTVIEYNNKKGCKLLKFSDILENFGSKSRWSGNEKEFECMGGYVWFILRCYVNLFKEVI